MVKFTPLRPCLHRYPNGAGCSALTDRTYCRRHQQEREGEQYQGRKSYRWQQLRRAALERAGWTCEHPGCAATTTLEAHHRDGDAAHNALSNLVVLCRAHHRTLPRELKPWRS